MIKISGLETFLEMNQQVFEERLLDVEGEQLTDIYFMLTKLKIKMEEPNRIEHTKVKREDVKGMIKVGELKKMSCQRYSRIRQRNIGDLWRERNIGKGQLIIQSLSRRNEPPRLRVKKRGFRGSERAKVSDAEPLCGDKYQKQDISNISLENMEFALTS